MSYDLVGLGELLWDCLPEGQVMGGAPGNVVFHARQLGLNAALATRIGDDLPGRELLRQVKSIGLPTHLIQVDAHRPTSLVTVELDQTGSAKYVFTPDCAWDGLEQSPLWLEACASARSICFGSLAQRGKRSHQTILSCLDVSRERSPAACRLFDINLRAPHIDREAIVASLRLTSALKLNEDEWPLLMRMVESSPQGFPSTTFEKASAEVVFEKFPDLQWICVTQGKAGLSLCTRGEWIKVAGQTIQVVDTVGAGDATSAGLIYGHLQQWPLEKTARFANTLGGLVSSHRGATPRLPLQQLAAQFEVCQFEV
jgi:fructokinase